MDWQAIWDWIWAERAWLGGVLATFILAVIGQFFGFFRWLIGLLRKPSTTDAESTASLLADKSEELGALKQREKDRSTIEDRESTIRELTAMVESLEQQRQQPDAPPGIDAALKQLEQGETGAAESIFQEILDTKKAGGRDANREAAAAAARHLGALYFLHDTQNAVSAYEEAVTLDPDDPDGWNQLGAMRYRLGQLDAAVQAYDRVQHLGNAVEDKTVIAVALGNLGLIYHTRGDLEKAEKYQLKSLALNEELGRTEGMASAYGNLGLIYRRRGDLEKAEEYLLNSLALNEELGRTEGIAIQHANLAQLARKKGNKATACEHWAKARRFFAEVGILDKLAQVEESMTEAGCPVEEDAGTENLCD